MKGMCGSLYRYIFPCGRRPIEGVLYRLRKGIKDVSLNHKRRLLRSPHALTGNHTRQARLFRGHIPSPFCEDLLSDHGVNSEKTRRDKARCRSESERVGWIRRTGKKGRAQGKEQELTWRHRPWWRGCLRGTGPLHPLCPRRGHPGMPFGRPWATETHRASAASRHAR